MQWISSQKLRALRPAHELVGGEPHGQEGSQGGPGNEQDVLSGLNGYETRYNDHQEGKEDQVAGR